jgi:hypothetical protein
MLAAVGLYFQSTRLESANAQLVMARKNLEFANNERRMAQEAQSETRFGALEGSSAEELVFVDNLRKLAQQYGLNLKSISGSMLTSLDRPLASAEDQKKLRGLNEVSTNLTIAGPYMSQRSFLRAVTSEDRLCNVKAVRWDRTKEGSDLSVTLARYIKVSEAPKK